MAREVGALFEPRQISQEAQAGTYGMRQGEIYQEIIAWGRKEGERR